MNEGLGGDHPELLDYWRCVDCDFTVVHGKGEGLFKAIAHTNKHKAAANRKGSARHVTTRLAPGQAPDSELGPPKLI